jgi:hypothetical protein
MRRVDNRRHQRLASVHLTVAAGSFVGLQCRRLLLRDLFCRIAHGRPISFSGAR